MTATAWDRVDDAGTAAPEPIEPPPPPSRPAWVLPLLISVTIVLAAGIFLYVMSSAFASPVGGCGGG